MIITELQAETTYSVTVAAYTTKGDGARSKPKLITTTGAGKVTITASTSTLDLMIELLLYNVVKLQLRRERAPSKYSCRGEKCSVNVTVSSSGITLTHLCDMAVLKALFKSMEIVASEKKTSKKDAEVQLFHCLEYSCIHKQRDR